MSKFRTPSGDVLYESSSWVAAIGLFSINLSQSLRGWNSVGHRKISTVKQVSMLAPGASMNWLTSLSHVDVESMVGARGSLERLEDRDAAIWQLAMSMPHLPLSVVSGIVDEYGVNSRNVNDWVDPRDEGEFSLMGDGFSLVTSNSDGRGNGNIRVRWDEFGWETSISGYELPDGGEWFSPAPERH